MEEAAVQVEKVGKRFGEVRALVDVSLEFERGLVYGLLGPNGAGKTTLIRILTTLIPPDSGRALVAGFDVSAHPVEVRRRIGLAGQAAAVDPFLTGRENVEMIGRLYGLGAAEARRRSDEVLERISLTEAADRPIRTYSGGMRRRLDLAASMVGRPQVLFLDEPTTGIDPRSRIEIWNLIRELVDDGTTILLTTQYLDEADQLADRIGVIDHGRLIAEGTAAQLKDTIGGARIEVEAAPGEVESAAAALREVAGEEPLRRGNRLAVHATAGSATLMEVVRALDVAAVTPTDIAMRKPTLDDVFLELTGRPAEEETAANGRRRSPA